MVLKYFSKRTPLWLPPGSVRAILALLIVVTAMFLFMTQREVTDGLIGIVGVVVAFYFNGRTSEYSNGASTDDSTTTTITATTVETETPKIEEVKP